MSVAQTCPVFPTSGENANAKSQVPDAISRTQLPSLSSAARMVLRFQSRCNPKLSKSFIQSYFLATESKTCLTSRAFSDSGTSRNPKATFFSFFSCCGCTGKSIQKQSRVKNPRLKRNFGASGGTRTHITAFGGPHSIQLNYGDNARHYTYAQKTALQVRGVDFHGPKDAMLCLKEQNPFG